MRGKLICFEGIDGTGKTTHALKLKEYLEKKNYKTDYFKMGTSYLADKITEINSGKMNVPFSTRSLLYAANSDYMDKMLVNPALDEGKIVILDRQYLTLVIYGTIRNKDQKWLEDINSKLFKPDITVVLSTSPERVLNNRVKEITMYETVRDDVKQADDPKKNYIALQSEVNQYYKKFIDNKTIFEVITEDEIDKTFEKIINLLNKELFYEKNVTRL